MKVYVNISEFINNDGITYRYRFILQVLLKLIEKNNDIILFTQINNDYVVVNNRILAEYFFTKKVVQKNIYVNIRDFTISSISDSDMYLEFDPICKDINELNIYYSTIVATGCEMCLFILDEVDDDFLDQNADAIKLQSKYMDKIYLSSQHSFTFINDKFGTNMMQLHVMELEKFMNRIKNDEYLLVDKGIQKLVNKDKYVVLMLDYAEYKHNHANLVYTRENYSECKVVIVLSPEQNAVKIREQLFRDKELGINLFVFQNIDYYSNIQLYKSAQAVIFPKNKSCYKFEILHIKEMNSKCVYL